MKKNLYTLIAAIVCMVATFNMQAQTVTGCYVPTYQQSQTQWCWATCGQMIYWSYKPGTITQCAFVNKSKEREEVWFGWWGCNNISNTSGSACTNPGTYNQPQSIYGCDGSMADVLNEYGIPSTNYGSSLSGATLASNLASKRLMVARWGWNGGGGHAVVINRYKNGNVYFNNPGNNSANIWSYNTFLNVNGQGSWTHTVRMNNSASYGSTYYKPETVTTVEEAAQSFSLNLYPNPTTEKVNILLNGEKSKVSQVIITDAIGKVMYSQAHDQQTEHVTLDVANWSRGLYFVSVNGQRELTKTLTLQ